MEGSVFSLPQVVLDQLVQHLEPKSALGRDWKGLAGVIGFNARHTAFIEARKSDSTRTLLIAWGQSGRSTVEKLVLALLCLEREDCIRILQSSLPGVDLTQLRATAARIKDIYTEVFAPFGDDYIICSYAWPTATTHMISEPLWRDNLAATPPLSSEEEVPSLPLNHTVCIQRENLVAGPARSPEEEAPSLSVNPSEATDVVPSKEKVFISYYPESSTRSSVASLVGDLELVGLSVHYANDREMMDAEFKTTAFARCFNIVVFVTPRYLSQYQQLDANPSLPSYLKIDRTMIRNIFFNEQKRLILVSLDEYMNQRCVPSLYQALRLYHYPSQLTDLHHCVTDVPKFIAPPPRPKISVEPTRIFFPHEVAAYQARQSAPLALPRSQRRSVQPIRIAPPPQSPPKKSLFGKMFKKR